MHYIVFVLFVLQVDSHYLFELEVHFDVLYHL